MKNLKFKNQQSFRTIKNFEISDYITLIGGALSGTTGGALLGAPLGFLGGLIGSLIGAFVTGYSSYKDLEKESHS